MTCIVARLPDGGTAIVCGPRGRKLPPRCATCFALATHQCDAQVGTKDTGVAVMKVTCDRWMCAGHRIPKGPGRDVCFIHAAVFEDSPPETPRQAAENDAAIIDAVLGRRRE